MRLKNIVFRLIVPTILFSSLIYLPKMLFHEQSVGIYNYLFDVWGGISFWFTSALSVAQLILIVMMLTGVRNIWTFFLVTAVLFAFGIYLNMQMTGNFPWYWRTALVYTFIITLGGIYHKYEQQIGRFMRYGWIMAVVVYICTVCFAHPIKTMGLGGKCNLFGFMAMLSSTLLLIKLAERLKQQKWLEYIGRNSIVFYFFSGVYPAVVGAVAYKFIPEGHYVVTAIVATMAVLLGVVTTYIINRFMPFLLDFRLLNRQA